MTGDLTLAIWEPSPERETSARKGPHHVTCDNLQMHKGILPKLGVFPLHPLP